MSVIYHNSYLITTKKDFIQEILIIKYLNFASLIFLKFPKRRHLPNWIFGILNTSGKSF